jgi:hypothetical protein
MLPCAADSCGSPVPFGSPASDRQAATRQDRIGRCRHPPRARRMGPLIAAPAVTLNGRERINARRVVTIGTLRRSASHAARRQAREDQRAVRSPRSARRATRQHRSEQHAQVRLPVAPARPWPTQPAQRREDRQLYEQSHRPATSRRPKRHSASGAVHTPADARGLRPRKHQYDRSPARTLVQELSRGRNSASTAS